MIVILSGLFISISAVRPRFDEDAPKGYWIAIAILGISSILFLVV